MRRLCSLDALPERGGELFLDAQGTSRDVLVFRLDEGGLAVYDAHCPHAGALLRPENVVQGRLVCFLHQWEFEVDTGACLTAPRLPLRTIPHEVRDGALWVDLSDIPVRGHPQRSRRLASLDPGQIRLRLPQAKPEPTEE